MVGFAILLGIWLGFGVIGAAMAYRGSMRAYGKDIYGWPLYLGTVVFGFPGFCASMVAW